MFILFLIGIAIFLYFYRSGPPICGLDVYHIIIFLHFMAVRLNVWSVNVTPRSSLADLLIKYGH